MENDFGWPLLHPLLAGRSSPASFDASFDVPEDQVEALVEAARWAPSAGNSQPWAFIVGRRGDATHERLIAHLAGSSATWALGATLLIANLAHRYVEGTDCIRGGHRLGVLGVLPLRPRPGRRPHDPSGPGARALRPSVPGIQP